MSKTADLNWGKLNQNMGPTKGADPTRVDTMDDLTHQMDWRCVEKGHQIDILDNINLAKL